MIVALASIAAWFANANAGVHIMSAVKAAAIATDAGNLGGIRLNGVSVTLAPGLVTLLLLVVLTQSMRAVDGKAGIAGVALGYAGAAALLGGVRLGDTFAPRSSTVIAALLLAAGVGVVVHVWNAVFVRLTDRWVAVARAAAAAALGYVALGSLVVAVSLAMHLNTATDLQRDLATGGAGLPVLLMGLAAVPNMVVAALGVLSGATVSFGGHSSVSLWSLHHGRLPAFPLFAAVPERPVSATVGLAVLAVAALFAGRLAHRLLPAPSTLLDALLDVLAAAGLTGFAAGVVTAAADGGLGTRSLAHLGGTWWQSGLFVALGVAAGSLVWLIPDLVRGLAHGEEPDDELDSSHDGTAAGNYVLARK